MSFTRCPAACVICSDRTCIQYKKHWTCGGHQLHIGDKIRDKRNGWTGWVYDAANFLGKRSVIVEWDTPHFDEGKMRSGKVYVANYSCNYLEKLPGPRKPENEISRK